MTKDSDHFSREPILVSGAHRSGTTWVGKMLAASGQAAYISEPLNIHHRPGVMRRPTRYWYTYICNDNESEYLPALRETLQLRYHTWAEMRAVRSSKDLMRMARDWNTFVKGRIRQQRPLLKDPFAIFSAAWFTDRLQCQVVITVRHPAAFASSLKRLNWPFDFSHLLKQPLLMRDWLAKYRDEMERLPLDDVIGQSGLLWSMIYSVVDHYRERYPGFQIIRHEDLSLDPLSGFKELYQALGLDFNAQAQATILQSSSTQNPKEVSPEAIHAYRLDSRANLDNWRVRLTTEEITRLRQLTGEVAAQFYPDSLWE